jgi:hypothetical protein
MAQNHHNPFENCDGFLTGEPTMRIAKVIFVTSVAALAATLPARAKHAESQKNDEKSTTSSSCHAYQQAPDGTWQQVPCEEAGVGQTQHRPPPKAAEDTPR